MPVRWIRCYDCHRGIEVRDTSDPEMVAAKRPVGPAQREVWVCAACWTARLATAN